LEAAKMTSAHVQMASSQSHGHIYVKCSQQNTCTVEGVRESLVAHEPSQDAKDFF
jgi:hypothetical protein